MVNKGDLFHYTRLTSPTSVRLLHLLPDQDSTSTPRLQLYEDDVSQIADYEALSYTWGTLNNLRPVLCNSSTLLVTQNCETALRELRSDTTNRLLWIDAICIDQSHTEERNAQVRLMGQIYNSASRVLVWLGRPTPDSDVALKFLSSFEPMLGKRGIERDEFVERKLREFQVIPKSYDGTDKDVMQDLIERSWFERVWTIQEIALARKALVVCGSMSINWDVFAFATYRLMKLSSTLNGNISTFGFLWMMMDMHQTVAEIFPFRAEISHLRSLIPTTLTNILVGTSGKATTEPKDRIFALYGVLKALKVDIPPPDYGKSEGVIYHEATRAAIERDRSLSILSHAQGLVSLPNTPSWSHIWNGKGQPRSISTSHFAASTHDSDVIFSFSPDGKKLTVQGQKYDIIKTRSRTVDMTGIERQDGEDNRVAAAKCFQNTVRMYQEWILLMNELWDHDTYDTDSNVAAAFFHMIVQDGSAIHEGAMKLPILQESMPTWYDYMISNLDTEKNGMQAIEDQLNSQSDRFPRIPEYLPQDLRHLCETDEFKIMQAIIQDPESSFFHMHASINSRMKAMFITESKLIGTATHAIDVGDEIFLISGFPIPLVLRPITGSDEYRVICPAFVQGLMYGAKWDDKLVRDVHFV